MKSQQLAMKSGRFSVILVGGSQVSYIPVIARTISNHPTRSSQNPPTINYSDTPKISVIFLNINTIKVGYFG